MVYCVLPVLFFWRDYDEEQLILMHLFSHLTFQVSENSPCYFASVFYILCVFWGEGYSQSFSLLAFPCLLCGLTALVFLIAGC